MTPPSRAELIAEIERLADGLLDTAALLREEISLVACTPVHEGQLWYLADSLEIESTNARSFAAGQRRNEMRPTISELEELLRRDQGHIEIQADGSIIAVDHEPNNAKPLIQSLDKILRSPGNY